MLYTGGIARIIQCGFEKGGSLFVAKAIVLKPEEDKDEIITLTIPLYNTNGHITIASMFDFIRRLGYNILNKTTDELEDTIEGIHNDYPEFYFDKALSRKDRVEATFWRSSTNFGDVEFWRNPNL